MGHTILALLSLDSQRHGSNGFLTVGKPRACAPQVNQENGKLVLDPTNNTWLTSDTDLVGVWCHTQSVAMSPLKSSALATHHDPITHTKVVRIGKMTLGPM